MHERNWLRSFALQVCVPRDNAWRLGSSFSEPVIDM
jgi:hypothetical protein